MVEKGRGERAIIAMKLWARRLLMSSVFAADLKTSRVQRLDGLGSSVMEWKPNEPRGLLKSSGLAVASARAGSCISRSGLADLDL